MGTNFPDFLKEANRMLKPEGMLIVAEVMGRFTDIDAFVAHVAKYSGFDLVSKDKVGEYTENVQEEKSPTAFYVMKLQKKRTASQKVPESFSGLLKPCTFKKRHMNQVSAKQKKKHAKRFSTWKSHIPTVS